MDDRIVLLMRHGATRQGAGKRLIGQCDEILSEEGLACARRRAADFAELHIAHVFCSALRRSMEMGRIIAPALGAELHIEPDLNELNLGAWDGLLVDEIRRRWPREYQQRGEDIFAYRTPGGENFADLKTRALPAFQRACETEGNLLLIGHRSVNRILLAHVLGLPPEGMGRIPQAHGGYHLLRQRDGHFTVEKAVHEEDD